MLGFFVCLFLYLTMISTKTEKNNDDTTWKQKKKDSVFSSLLPHHLLSLLLQIRFLIKEAALIAQEFIGPRMRKWGLRLVFLPWPWFRSVFYKSYLQKRWEVVCLNEYFAVKVFKLRDVNKIISLELIPVPVYVYEEGRDRI